MDALIVGFAGVLDLIAIVLVLLGKGRAYIPRSCRGRNRNYHQSRGPAGYRGGGCRSES